MLDEGATLVVMEGFTTALDTTTCEEMLRGVTEHTSGR
jgi:hypothetical protein